MIPDRIADLPCWRGDITAEPLSGGLSNEAWLVRDNLGGHVVRFGKDYPFHHVSRDREAIYARAAHAAGFGPKVEFAGPGVMVSTFLDARTWDAASMRAAPGRLARLLRRFHTEMPGHISGPAFLFDPLYIIRDYGRTLAGTRWSGRVPGLLALATSFDAVQIPMRIIFGHHDMLPANVLETSDRLWLIDFEYAGFGTAMFDLASAASNARMTPDESTELVACYLDRAPDPAFQRAFDAMRCTALIREAMWAMVSDQHLTTPGVNFADYAQENLATLALMTDDYQSNHGKLVQ